MVTCYEHPQQKVTIAGVEIQGDCLTTDVWQRENKIWDALIVANDEEGKTFLAQANLSDEVCIWYKYEDGDDTFHLVFSGWIDDLNPTLNVGGETCAIKAFGKGHMLMNMRIADEFGEGSKYMDGINVDLVVNDWTNVNWQLNHFGVEPWIDSDDADTSYIGQACIVGRIGFYDEYYGFPALTDLLACYDKFDADLMEIVLKGRLVDLGSGVPTSVELYIYLYDCESETYSNCGTISINTQIYTEYRLDVTACIDWDLGKFNNTRLKIMFGGITGLQQGEWRVTYAYMHLEGQAYCYTSVCSILQDRVIPDFVEEILDTGVDSGYDINDEWIYNPLYMNVDCEAETEGCGEYAPFRYKYLYFPYVPIVFALRDMLNLADAGRILDECERTGGMHWIVKPKCGEESLLMIAPIGNHNIISCSGNLIEDEWATMALNGTTLEVTKDMVLTSFNKRQIDGNYIVLFGKYEFPSAGDSVTEGNVGEWAKIPTMVLGGLAFSGTYTLRNDNVNPMIGYQSIYMDMLAAGAIYCGAYYPNTFDLNINVLAIGTEKTFPQLGFYCQKHNIGAGGMRVWMGTGNPIAGNFFSKVFTNEVPNDDEWTWVTLPIGPYYSMKEVDMTPWTTVGTPNWNQIDWILFVIHRPAAGQTNFWIDGLRINGILTRVAYNSINITANKCRIKLLTDSLAKSAILDEDDDSGILAQFAKSELYRAQTTPITGTIQICLQPEILAGQIVHTHASRKETGFNIDKDMRITEHHLHFGTDTVTSDLTLTDDLLNSYPRGVTDSYNSIMKATNPDFQDRDRGDLKGRDIDILQVPLRKDYPS